MAGRILIPDYNALLNEGWHWSPHTVTSLIGGAEMVDFSGMESDSYQIHQPVFEPAADMVQRRHFHNMTILPSGRVAVVGGNSFGNSGPRDHYNNPCNWNGEDILSRSCSEGCPSVCIDNAFGVCDEAGSFGLTCSAIDNLACENNQTCDDALAGAVCANGYCRRDCVEEGEFCGLIQDCVLTSSSDPSRCGAFNNECYATETAEIWDPECNAWVELDEQESPRMYHSTALLMPDGRVLSMGGGHRDFGLWSTLAEYPVSEYLQPTYAEDPDAPRPEFALLGSSDPSGEAYLPWDGWVLVDMLRGVQPERATLVRLGSTTHGFDQDQRFIELELEKVDGSMFRIFGPQSQLNSTIRAQHIAPPGYYMLFLLSEEGQPSMGSYIRVGEPLP